MITTLNLKILSLKLALLQWSAQIISASLIKTTAQIAYSLTTVYKAEITKLQSQQNQVNENN